jgi:hypothetical protein
VPHLSLQALRLLDLVTEGSLYTGDICQHLICSCRLQGAGAMANAVGWGGQAASHLKGHMQVTRP